MLGFKLDEIMTGTHNFVSQNEKEGELPINFSVTWGNKSLLKFLNPFSEEFFHSELKGFITVGGLVEKANCTGTLSLLYFTERKIRYEFSFKDDSGKQYQYIGEKVNIWPWNLHKTHVTCYGSVMESKTGKTISKSIVYFPLRETLAFILSFRFRVGSVFKYT